jgi:hypothetical protein
MLDGNCSTTGIAAARSTSLMPKASSSSAAVSAQRLIAPQVQNDTAAGLSGRTLCPTRSPRSTGSVP